MLPVLSLFRLAEVVCGTDSGIFSNLYHGLTCAVDKSGGTGPAIKSVRDVVEILFNLVAILTQAAGGIAVIVIVVAAIFYITSAGNEGRIKMAKDILQNVAIGLVLITIAYALIIYVAGFF